MPNTKDPFRLMSAWGEVDIIFSDMKGVKWGQSCEFVADGGRGTFYELLSTLFFAVVCNYGTTLQLRI